MSYQLIYTPIALVEYKDAVSWYDERSKRVAENFVIAVREQIKSICEKPSRYKNRYNILEKQV